MGLDRNLCVNPKRLHGHYSGARLDERPESCLHRAWHQKESNMSRSINTQRNQDCQHYSPPSLKIYGDVTVLTASGVSGVAENGNQPNCSTSATRRPC